MQKQPSPRITAPLTIAAALGLALVLTGCGRRAAAPPSGAAPTAVQIAVAAVAAAPEFVTATGAVEPILQASPGTKIMGRVDQVMAQMGDQVRKGQTLALLDDRDLQAGVGQAEAGLKMAEANLGNAEAMHRRMVMLHERGSATDKNLEDAATGLHLAEAGLDQARANLAAAQVMLGYAEIKSPLSGFVTAKRIEVGDMAAPGAPLFTVEDLSRAKIVAEVPEASVVGMKAGQPAKVRVDVLDADFDATVDRVVPAGDPMSRTFRVELLLANPQGRLKSGMFARVRFERGVRQALLAPKTALVRRGELRGLFVVGADGAAQLRWVRLGRETDDQVEVISGLTAGERFIPAPPPGLADGAPVTAR